MIESQLLVEGVVAKGASPKPLLETTKDRKPSHCEEKVGKTAERGYLPTHAKEKLLCYPENDERYCE